MQLRRELYVVAQIGAELTLASLQQFRIRRGNIVLFLRLAEAIASFTGATRAIKSTNQLLSVGFDGASCGGVWRGLHTCSRAV